MERSDSNGGRNRNHPNYGSDDSTLPPKESSCRKNILGREIRRFVLSRVGVNGNQKLSYKLRLLNKSEKERVERGIKEARINILSFQGLATSRLNVRIQNMDVFVKGLSDLQNLPILSPVFFPSIKNINLIITEIYNEEFRLNIQEPLIVSNLNVVNQSNLQRLYILGKYDVVMQDCTFKGLSIECSKNAQVSVVNSRFMNMGCYGFHCFDCNSLFMDQITIQDCEWYGCLVRCCGNVCIDNIQLVSCGMYGIMFNNVNGFKLRNAFVQDCGQSGIVVCIESIGEIQSAHVQGCKGYGIFMWQKSIVRYAQIQCDDNAQGEFRVNDNCQFLRMS